MSEQNPYQTLGVSEDASFDEIQEAKQQLCQQYQNDSRVLDAIESAYDSIIMDRLRLRQEGKIKVPERIRFPERDRLAEPTTPLNSLPINTPPVWLQGFIDHPQPREVLIPAGVFSVLGIMTVFGQNSQESIVPLLLTLGIFANVFFLNRKKNNFWRSVLISLIVLFLGISIGAFLFAWLRSFNTPLDNQQLYALITFCLFWLSSSFLR